MHLTQGQDEDEPALLLAKFQPVEAQEEVYLNEQHVVPKLKSSKDIENRTKVWYLDNGASNHMTGDKDKFQELDEGIRGYVRFGDASKVRIEGKGSIVFQCKTDERRVLQEVYFIPSLCSNIISLGQLAETGDEILMKGSFLWVRDKTGRLLMKVKRSPNRLYKIILNEAKPKCLLGSSEETSWLWHARLGHVNFQSLKRMAEKKIVLGLPNMEQPVQLCKGCIDGKHSRNPFPTHTFYRAKARLELIHADLCGPITPSTPSGNRYFLLLVDDFSRVMWLYLLKDKDEALGVFRKFRLLVENETGEKMKVLRTDRGGEFFSKQFEAYCDESGLRHHFTAPYSPQQNGVVERRNRTVVEMIRSMLSSMEIPKVLWGEAARHATYILNRVTTKALGDKTPYEVWSGRKPNLEHVRAFGCLAHAKLMRGNLQKLDNRSEVLVHLGMEAGSKAYRLLDPNTGRIRVSRDVYFEENKVWPWESAKKIRATPGVILTFGTMVQDQEHEVQGVDPLTPLNHAPGDDYVSEEVVHESPLEQDTQSSDHQQTPIPTTPTSSVGSTSPASSSTGGGAPKRYRTLAELYEECDELLFMQDMDEPVNYSMASTKREWVQAMKSELEAIERNHTWKLVDLPAGRKPIGLKWV